MKLDKHNMAHAVRWAVIGIDGSVYHNEVYATRIEARNAIREQKRWTTRLLCIRKCLVIYTVKP